MKLNLKKLDELIEKLGADAPAALFQDASLFNPASLKKIDQARPAGANHYNRLIGLEKYEGYEADVIGK